MPSWSLQNKTSTIEWGSTGMTKEFKPVPAVYKCFELIELLAASSRSMGISAMASELGFHRSTVFNIVYSLENLDILAQTGRGKFRLSTKFFQLAKTQTRQKGVIRTVRPFLKTINKKTQLSVFLGVKSGLHAVIIEKVDDITGFKISSDIGDSHPIFAGAGGKALLSQIDENELDDMLNNNTLPTFTPFSCTDKEEFKEMIRRVDQEKIAYDMEEYTEGIRAVAVPLDYKENVPAAIWVVGLKGQLPEEKCHDFGLTMKQIAESIKAELVV